MPFTKHNNLGYFHSHLKNTPYQIAPYNFLNYTINVLALTDPSTTKWLVLRIILAFTSTSDSSAIVLKYFLEKYSCVKIASW